MSSALDPVTDLKSPRCIWFRDIRDPDKIRVYMEHLIAKYCQSDMAVLGPDSWYISEAGYYKATSGTQHECFVATLQLTPRLSKQSPSPEASDSQPIYLTLERDKDFDTVEVPGSDSSHSEAKIKYSIQGRLANDTASISRLPKDEEEDYKLLFHMKFPPPSSKLPHEEDIDAVFEELEQCQLLGHTAPESRFISLPTLISLANCVSQVRDNYEATSSNCYWYSSVIFFCLRKYTSSEIIFANDQKILLDDSVDIMKERFQVASINQGHFGIVKLVEIPTDQIVVDTLSMWEPLREAMNSEIRTHQLAHIDARRNEREKIRKMEDEMKKKEDEMKKKDDQRRKAEERLRYSGWTEREIENLFNC